MSIFAVGANAGFALGAALVTPVVAILVLAALALQAAVALGLTASLPGPHAPRPRPVVELADGSTSLSGP